MYIPLAKRGSSAFSRMDLLVVLGVVFVLGAIGLALFFQKKRTQVGQTCVMNLRIVTLAWKMWPPDSEEVSPWRFIGPGSTAAFINSGTVLPHYLALSNNIPDPKALTCPSDTRIAATNWATLTDSNISYFINFNSESTHPMRVAFGDRRFTSTIGPTNNLLILTTNASYSWDNWIHAGLGTLSYSDGSVRQLSKKELTPELHFRENLGSRLQLPR